MYIYIDTWIYILKYKEVTTLGMVKILVHVSKPIKAKLDALRATGTTASGLIRHLLNQHFGLKQTKDSKEERSTKAKS